MPSHHSSFVIYGKLRKLIPEIETKSREEINNYQISALKDNLEYLNQKSIFYQDLFKKNHIDIKKIKSLEDLKHIPVTTKDDLQQRNKDFLCVPPAQIIDYITTSGTQGDPVTLALTDGDLERLAYNEAISFACADGTDKDIYQLMTTIDRRFMAGLAYFIGVRKLGAGIVRVGNGIPELQWDTIRRISPTALIAVPSFIYRLLEYAESHDIDYSSFPVKKAVCIGESLRNQDFSLNILGQKICEKWKIKLYSTYASSEIACAFTECKEGKGGHHHPELVIIEFLDDNNMPVKEGEIGEITITTLGIEGMPVLRFKTDDMCQYYTEPCACGRNTLRIGPIIGRKKQMIKYKGTSLYPPALFNVLDDNSNIFNYVVEVFTNDLGNDDILIRIGCNEIPEGFECYLKDRFRTRLRVAPSLSFESIQEITQIQFPELSRKPVKFIDKRRQNKM